MQHKLDCAKIIVAGDFCPQGEILQNITRNNYDDFSSVASVLDSGDYNVVNMECPVLDNTHISRLKKTGPVLKTSSESLKCLKSIGFDCITLANNHIKDYGQEGIESTIQYAKEFGLDYLGAGLSLREAKKVLIKNIGDLKVAFINACEHEWSIATFENCGAAPLDLIELFEVINYCKGLADYIIVIIHGGIEHYIYPTPGMKRRYRYIIDVGADIVINHHQHCFSGFEKYKNGLIFYGLGNFSFYDRRLYDKKWTHGILVEIILTRNNGIFYEIYPYIQGDINFKGVRVIEKNAFYEDLRNINEVIQDDVLLAKEYDHLAKTRKQYYKYYFQPYLASKFMLSAFNRNILPDMLSIEQWRYILNLIRCESHRDLLLNILETIVRNEK